MSIGMRGIGVTGKDVARKRLTSCSFRTDGRDNRVWRCRPASNVS